MKACNVEIFDAQMNYICHDVIETPMIDNDYLAADTTSISINRFVGIPKNGYVWIRGDFSFFGFITDSVTDDEQTTVNFLPFINKFDQEVLFDTKLQGGKDSLETVLGSFIDSYWVHNSDALQNIPIDILDPSSETTNWGFNLKSDTEGMHHCIINFYDVLLRRSLTKYGIAMTIIPSPNDHKIRLSIGAPRGTPYIDADLPNVVVDTFKVNQAGRTTNKMVIWNAANYTDKVEYYLHPDGSYNTINSDRITPVVSDISSVMPNDQKPFPVVAAENAASTFSGIEWTNEIKLIVQNDDPIITPANMAIGQQVKIIRNGIEYTTLLTGKVLDHETTLIFGTIRLDLTKKIKMERKG
jgi:hypothetical protein